MKLTKRQKQEIIKEIVDSYGYGGDPWIPHFRKDAKVADVVEYVLKLAKLAERGSK